MQRVPGFGERSLGIPSQEQAMAIATAIAMALAGYAGSEADERRRTMGNARKEKRLLPAQEKLRVRMETMGVGADVALTICDDL
jgi:DNA polymerase III alpha subunit